MAKTQRPVLLFHALLIVLGSISALPVEPHASPRVLLDATNNRVAHANTSDPGSYYDSIDTNLDGRAFQSELTTLISRHESLSYAELWTAFRTTDQGLPGDPCPINRITDIYSAKCWIPGTEQCGNYAKEGDCYNREHSWPQSAWGGSKSSPAYTDLFHIYPTDGYDNGRRGNYWLGDVAEQPPPRWVTSNGCMLGACVASKTYNATGVTNMAVPALCWEPADRYKGELARVYFYVETRYYNEFTCCDTDGADGAIIKPWMLDILLVWHAQHPVSARERARNDIIYRQFQGNRNPFVDHPEWTRKIYATR